MKYGLLVIGSFVDSVSCYYRISILRVYLSHTSRLSSERKREPQIIKYLPSQPWQHFIRMLLNLLPEVSLIQLLLLSSGIYTVYILLRALLDPLRDVPGPFLARFTRWWYFFEVYKGNYELRNIELHNKHGPIVRIAPGEYSIDDVDAVKTIYGYGSAFVKVHRAKSYNPLNLLFTDILIRVLGTMVLGLDASHLHRTQSLHRPRSSAPRFTTPKSLLLLHYEYTCKLRALRQQLYLPHDHPL